MNKARMIVIEGGDGAGKGLTSGVVARELEARGIGFVRSREPGGTPEGEALRTMLLAESGSVWEPASEIMLMTTSRIQHMARVIRPALERGDWVLCDRFVHSTVAYQGYGHQGPVDLIRQLHRDVVGDFMPDLTIVLDIDPEVGIARAKRRLEETGIDEGRMENLTMDFHRRVRQGYLDMVEEDPCGHMLVDASRTIPEVKVDVEARFGAWLDMQERWIVWDGTAGAMPEVDPSQDVLVRRRNGRTSGPHPAGRIGWHHQDVPSDIMFYQGA